MKKLCGRIWVLVALLLVGGCKSPIGDGGGAEGRVPVNKFSVDGVPLGSRDGFFIGGTEQRGLFESVYFAYDSSQIAGTERAKVELVADYFRQNALVGLIVEGHSDERGSNEYNLALGERRALSIRAYLAELGIAPERIQTRSYGEEQPVAAEHDESAWSENRRGEFVVYE